MDLSLTEEQSALQDSVRSLIEDRFSCAEVRACETDPARAKAIYRDLGALGLGAILVSEDKGGLGLGLTDMAVAQAELGRGAVPMLFAESTVFCASLLDASGAEPVQEVLDGIVAGECLVACAFEPGTKGTEVSFSDAGDGVLSGQCSFVTEAAFADKLLVKARDAEGDTVLCLVDRAAAGLVLTDLPNLAEQAMSLVRFDQVPVQAVIGQGADADHAWTRALARTRVAIAAQAVGGAERVFEITCEYARTRQQFGRPIGGFQAIAHMLAEAATHIEGARILVYRAAAAADEGDPFTTWADLAKLKACQAYRDVSATAIQVHGGIGFTLEADPQLFFRRAKHLQLMYGDPLDLEEQAGAALIAGTHKVIEA